MVQENMALLYPRLGTSWESFTLVSAVLGALSLFFSESMGLLQLGYSESAADATTGLRAVKVPFRLSFVLMYAPGRLVGIIQFLKAIEEPAPSARPLLVAVALTLHFGKRNLESLCLHKYSGKGVDLPTLVFISSGYTLGAILISHVQFLTEVLPTPAVDMRLGGLVLVMVGLMGNLYHHWLLANLKRPRAGKGYAVPSGGLFPLVACPHYLFEIVTFIGMAMLAQTWVGCSRAFFTVCYLLGRSIATRRWYLQKVKGFPADRRALVPYVL